MKGIIIQNIANLYQVAINESKDIPKDIPNETRNQWGRKNL